MSVYIITARELGMAKIGFSVEPRKRLTMLNTGSPAKLQLEAVIPGSMENEKQLQNHFRDQRSHFEWFQINDLMESIILKFPPFRKKLEPISSYPSNMDFKQIVADYESRARKLDMKMYLVCEKAGVAASTYYRWLSAGDAKVSNLIKIEEALIDLEKEKAA